MPRRSILMFAGACLAIAAVLVIITVIVANGRDNAQSARNVTSTGQPLIGGDFQLVDYDGKPVDQTVLDGKWSLVFFGFTYCPDFCPTTLAELAGVQNLLGDKAENLQMVFITVDPERDTTQQLKDYLSSDGFPENTIGLTGTPEQIAQVARAYRVFYQKVGEGEGYTMNHTTTVYLMGPDGKFRSAIAYGLGPQKAATVVGDEIDRG